MLNRAAFTEANALYASSENSVVDRLQKIIPKSLAERCAWGEHTAARGENSCAASRETVYPGLLLSGGDCVYLILNKIQYQKLRRHLSTHYDVVIAKACVRNLRTLITSLSLPLGSFSSFGYCDSVHTRELAPPSKGHIKREHTLLVALLS